MPNLSKVIYTEIEKNFRVLPKDERKIIQRFMEKSLQDFISINEVYYRFKAKLYEDEDYDFSISKKLILDIIHEILLQ